MRGCSVRNNHSSHSTTVDSSTTTRSLIHGQETVRSGQDHENRKSSNLVVKIHTHATSSCGKNKNTARIVRRYKSQPITLTLFLFLFSCVPDRIPRRTSTTYSIDCVVVVIGENDFSVWNIV